MSLPRWTSDLPDNVLNNLRWWYDHAYKLKPFFTGTDRKWSAALPRGKVKRWRIGLMKAYKRYLRKARKEHA